MKSHASITAFYLETLLLVVVFVSVLLVLTDVFGRSRAQSANAGDVNCAVTLAQNTAEAFAAAENEDRLREILADAVCDDSLLRFAYDKDLTPDPDGFFVVELTWRSEPQTGGVLDYADITVRRADSGTVLYTLNTAQFRKGGQ